jgi:hypothetical protein
MKNKIVSKPLFILAALVAIGAGVGISGYVSAQVGKNGDAQAKHMMDKRGPGVMGTVSSVNGTTILVAGKTKDAALTAVTYTVDASTAKFTKFVEGAQPAAATIVDVKVGDTVAVRGTVTGTSVKAESVMDGVPAFDKGRMGGMMHGGTKGTISAINGTTITATVTDAANIKVGDSILVIPEKQQ